VDSTGRRLLPAGANPATGTREASSSAEKDSVPAAAGPSAAGDVWAEESAAYGVDDYQPDICMAMDLAIENIESAPDVEDTVDISVANRDGPASAPAVPPLPVTDIVSLAATVDAAPADQLQAPPSEDDTADASVPNFEQKEFMQLPMVDVEANEAEQKRKLGESTHFCAARV
jgi:hypothetical protein